MAKILAIGSELEARMIKFFEQSAEKGETFVNYISAYTIERNTAGELWLNLRIMISQELLDTVLGIEKGEESDSQGPGTDSHIPNPYSVADLP